MDKFLLGVNKVENKVTNKDGSPEAKQVITLGGGDVGVQVQVKLTFEGSDGNLDGMTAKELKETISTPFEMDILRQQAQINEFTGDEAGEDEEEESEEVDLEKEIDAE